jgi:hypothetical protein
MRAFLFIALFFSQFGFSQELDQFNTNRLKTDQKLMLTLGSWSAMNLIGSGIGWATSGGGEARYFHQMNVMWNTVNMGLAVPGYIKARKANHALSLGQTIDEQFRTEKIFLFNTALDLTYMTAGILLRNESKYNLEKSDQFMGFGNSLLLQGGFLFLFDLAAYTIHVRHRKKVLSPLLERVSVSSNGMGVRIILPIAR